MGAIAAQLTYSTLSTHFWSNATPLPTSAAYLVPLSLAFDDMEGPHAYTFFTYLNIVGSEFTFGLASVYLGCGGSVDGRHRGAACLHLLDVHINIVGSECGKCHMAGRLHVMLCGSLTAQHGACAGQAMHYSVMAQQASCLHRL